MCLGKFPIFSEPSHSEVLRPVFEPGGCRSGAAEERRMEFILANVVISAESVGLAATCQNQAAPQIGLYGQAFKCIWWMPRQLKAMKDVVACDKPRGVSKQTLIRGFPNGETHCPPLQESVSAPEYIGCGGEPGELKYLSTRRKRNQPRFPQ